MDTDRVVRVTVAIGIAGALVGMGAPAVPAAAVPAATLWLSLEPGAATEMGAMAEVIVEIVCAVACVLFAAALLAAC